MTLRFTLPIPAFSVNRAYARDRRFKTSAYNDWATKAMYYLKSVDGLEQIKAAFDATKGKGSFFIQIVAYYPGYVFFNKQGQISSKTVDCSNMSKNIIDLLFGDCLDINDKHITKLAEEKRAGSDYSLEITLILNA